MAFVLEDRVVETANNPGQGDFELLGAVENNRTFVAAIGNGNTTRYLAVGAEGWEIGVAQVSAGSPDQLLRPGTVTKNSDGSTSPINFAGTVTVACVASIEDVLWLDENGDLPARGGRDLGTADNRWRDAYLRNALLGGNLQTLNFHIGSGSGQNHIHTKSDIGTFILAGGSASNRGGNVLLRAPDSDGGLSELRNGSITQLTWGDGGVRADGGAGWLLPVATVHEADYAYETNLPIGTYVWSLGPREGISRNQSAVVTLDSNNSRRYALAGHSNAGNPLSGTWRQRGVSDTLDMILLQRVS